MILGGGERSQPLRIFWKAAFGSLIESKIMKPSDRMYYLKKYLKGDAYKAVEGYFLLNTEEAYQEAKEDVRCKEMYSCDACLFSSVYSPARLVGLCS